MQSGAGRGTLCLRGEWDGKSSFTPVQLTAYQNLQKKGEPGVQPPGDAWVLHYQRLRNEEAQTIIWNTLQVPKGGVQEGERSVPLPAVLHCDFLAREVENQ